MSCRIRPATDHDSEMLFDWVNRADSIESSNITSGPVAWDDHCRWFAERLSDPRTRIWIVEGNGNAVGQIRLQDKGNGPEIAIYLDEKMRGLGIAAEALDLALAEARSAWPGVAALARIRADNPRSQRFFESRGFEFSTNTTGHKIYTRML